MTNRFEDADYRRALDDQVRARAQREAWDAVSFLTDVVTGRVPVPDPEEHDDQLSWAFSAIESFVSWEGPDREPPSAELSALIFSGTPPALHSDPPRPTVTPS
jgi:hypothetical protein